MQPITDLEGIEDPILCGAGEALHIIRVRGMWAAHHIVSYTDRTADVQDLVECERVLMEMKGEIDRALRSVGNKINEEDAEITRAQAEGGSHEVED